MAPKRAATPESSSSSSEANSDSASYSSDKAGDEGAETRRPSSPPKQKPTQKSSTTPLAPTPQPIVKSSKNLPSAAAASGHEQGDDEDDTDQEQSSREDESGSESDTDDARTNKRAPPPPVHPLTKPQPQSSLSKPTSPKPSSDSGSSEGSDSGSDSSQEDATPAPVPRPSRAADPSIKPISTKPMDGPTRLGKPVGSPALTLGRDSSFRTKGDSVDSTHKDNNGGRHSFQRFWSLDDEITLLNGVVEYRLKNDCLPSRTSGMDAVHDCIKDSLQIEVTSSQLVNKLRSLKKKFETNVARQKNGTGPTFTKRQEQVAFELSKKLWGIGKVSTEDVGASTVNEDNKLCEREMKVNQKRKEGNLKPVDVSHLSYVINKKFKGTDKSQYPLLSETVTKMADEKLCGVAIMRALEMLDDVKANLMEEKLKKFKITEIKQHMRRNDLNTKTLKLIYDAIMRSS